MDEVKVERRYLVIDGKWVGGNIGFLRWSYRLVVYEILDLMTKAVATVSAMTALLMVHTVLWRGYVWLGVGREEVEDRGV